MKQGLQFFDTIAAIVTPVGQGAVGIVRLSGPLSYKIGLDLFRKTNNSRLAKPESHRVYFGRIVSLQTKQALDEVLISFFKSPKSYTGEDVVEISAHGGKIRLADILNAVILAGARSAQPGEYTKRAFLNGRLDLSQAEAVDDMISAKTSRAANLAWNQLTGENSQWLSGIKRALIRIMADLTAELEFPDDFQSTDLVQLASKLKKINEKIAQTIGASKPAIMIKEGVRLAIVGRANVGKSTLFNALLGRNRAITSSWPGTTRDFLEESVDLGGIPVTLIDTAGWKNRQHNLDRLSWRKTKQAINTSSLVIFMLDATGRVTKGDKKLWRLVAYGRDMIIVALNKIDRQPVLNKNTINQTLGPAIVIAISALKQTGLNTLRKAIGRMLINDDPGMSSKVVFSSQRHLSCLKSAQTYISKAINNLGQALPLDMISLDIQQSWEILGEITGQTATQKLLDSIFSRFCLGK